ncbi:type II secretion system protein [Lentilactobacillus sp. Marseille-Q4993]|uniref:type II secretion system protein n=1 Tax=Lentilactobacillus sp. Marseille-Q4993 TaxID=3039492 RepID=UPI0024BC4537|nr:type II secretion system protein [Lentilactobacillus sp. Marseille-Q4993]
MKKSSEAFTLVDAVIGLTIIVMFSLLFIAINSQLGLKVQNDQDRMVSQRESYERTYAK